MIQQLCRRVRDSPIFKRGIIALIIIAAVLIGFETSPDLSPGTLHLLHTLDLLILGIFTLEIVIKVLAEGRRPLNFFRDPWNVFDFLIVTACFIPAWGSWAAVARILRILRVFRLINALPRLQFLVNVLLKSIPSMGYVGLLLILLFYVYGVIGVFLFRANDPVHFGDLPTAILSLFRIVTLEDWTDIMYIQIYGSDVYRTGMEFFAGQVDPQAFGWPAALYFISFVLTGSLVMLNLFIGVIVNGIHELHKEPHADEDPETTELIERLQKDLDALRERLNR